MIRVRYQLLLLAFVVLGIYYPVIFAPFCSTDDYRMIESLRNQDSFDIYRLFFPHGGQYYRPLLYLTFIVDKYAWGLEESFMHLENLVLHLCNALLVFASVRMLFRAWKIDPGPWSPLAAALIFALHPINTEAVAWVSGRTDLLACFFVLLSLWFLAAFLHGRNTLAAVLSGLALILGALSKEPALLFAPPAVFLVVCHDHRFGKGRSWQERSKAMLLPVLAIASSAAIYLIMRTAALSVVDKGVAQVAQLAQAPAADLANLARVAAKLSGFYLKKLFMPLPLNFAILEVSNYYVVPGALFLALLCYLLYRRSLTGFLAIAAFCICAPCFILAVSRLSWTPVAERYLYMPSAFFAMVLAIWGLSCVRRLNWATPVLLVLSSLILGGSAYATTSRNIVWQDNYTLFADTAAKSPAFHTAKNDMAVALLKRGDSAEAYRVLRELPVEDSHLATMNLAQVYMAEGNLTDARRLLYDRLKEDRGYRTEMLALLVKIAETRRAEAVASKEKRLLNQELFELISQQYQRSGDPFYQYRLGLVHLQFNDSKAAFNSFSSAKSAAPAGSHYRQAAIRLADKFRP